MVVEKGLLQGGNKERTTELHMLCTSKDVLFLPTYVFLPFSPSLFLLQNCEGCINFCQPIYFFLSQHHCSYCRIVFCYIFVVSYISDTEYLQQPHKDVQLVW
jgi:hypothetical protein